MHNMPTARQDDSVTRQDASDDLPLPSLVPSFSSAVSTLSEEGANEVRLEGLKV
jgi:hypothetical protein